MDLRFVEVKSPNTDEVIGFEIYHGDDVFMISLDQVGWPGIRSGIFPTVEPIRSIYLLLRAED